MTAPAVRLPTDTPPHMGPTNRAGLITHGWVGDRLIPLYAQPWNSAEFTTFPDVEPSAVAPNGIKTKAIVAINTYSPIAHRSTLTTTMPTPTRPARGVATPTQRPRSYAAGYVTAWPQMAPRWPSWGEAPGARKR